MATTFASLGYDQKASVVIRYGSLYHKWFKAPANSPQERAYLAASNRLMLYMTGLGSTRHDLHRERLNHLSYDLGGRFNA